MASEMAIARQVLSRGANQIAKKRGFAAVHSEIIIFEANLPKVIAEMTAHPKLGIAQTSS